MNEWRKLVTRAAVEQVESEARAVAGLAKGGYTLRVVRDVRWVFSRRLKVSNVFDSLIATGNSFQIVGEEKLKVLAAKLLGLNWISSNRLDWIEQCFTCPPTQYRLYGRREAAIDQKFRHIGQSWKASGPGATPHLGELVGRVDVGAMWLVTLFRARMKVMLTTASHFHWISRKPLETWFQRTTNRKWPMG